MGNNVAWVYNNEKFCIFGNPYREEKWQYPLDAIRELVINAIIHRDYRRVHSQFKIFPEKLEFWNSGKIPNDLTLVDLKINEIQSGFDMEVFSTKLNGGLNGTLNELLRLIKKNSGIKLKKLSDVLSKSIDTLDKQIKKLINTNKVERRGVKNGGYCKK